MSALPEFETNLKALVAETIQWTDETLSEARAEAARYYAGEPFGNEEEGRSQLVLTEVRDGVQGVLPSLLRVVFGPMRVLEFVPADGAQVAAARAATEAVHQLFLEQNGGFLKAHSVLKDGLIKKLGVFKWGCDVVAVEGEPYERQFSAEEWGVFLQTKPAEVQVVALAVDEMTGAVMATLRVDGERKRHWVDALPPEEFLFDREARTLDDATFIGHRRNLPAHHLLAMGVTQDDLDAHGGTDWNLRDNPEADARREVVSDADDLETPELDEAGRLHLWVEGYVFKDGKRRKVGLLGPAHHLVVDEAWDGPLPFAPFCPDPEPHKFVGHSWADRLMDMQKWKSSLVRASSDSLALAIFPRTEVVEGKVNLEDVLNTEIGAPIRVKEAGSVREIAHSFLGKEAMPLLGYADDIVERRTGRNRGTAGLDANSLQSSTREGVQAVLTQSQEQQELLVRLFCEMTLKPLFRGLLHLLVTHPTDGMRVRLGGAWEAIDPARWDVGMGVSVNVALGTADPDRRANDLALILQKQEAILAQMGPDNPLVKLPQYYQTLAELLRLRGHRDVDAYFTAVPPDWTPPPPPPTPPTPEQVLAQAQLEVEKMKTERELTIKAEELALKQAEQRLAHERGLAEQQAKADLERYKAELDAQVRLEVARLDAETKLRIAGEKAVVDAAKVEVEGEKVEVQAAKVAADAAKADPPAGEA